MARMKNGYILLLHVGAITGPCPNPNAGFANFC